MAYVIGCDVGSQSAKALLVSEAGEVVGEAAQSYAIDYPQPLWAQQPVERWINALTLAIRQLLANTGVNKDQILALGIATQVDGVVPIDDNGLPLHPAIIWMDRRAQAQVDSVQTASDPEQTFNLTGLNLDAVHVAPKIRWLLETYPDLKARYFLLPGSYIAYYLTGEVAVDYSNASSTLLLDVRTRNWSAEMCQRFQIDPVTLGPVRPATDPLGTLRPEISESLGLNPNTIVVVGSGDEHAACLGAGVVRPGLVADIAGTAEPVCAVSPEPLFDPTHLVETHCHADPAYWLLENPGFVSGANLRWYRDHFSPLQVQTAAAQNTSPYQLLDEQAQSIPTGSEGVIFLPCLMGAMAPTWNPNARGAFFGFTLAHTHAHFTRAVLEGSAYAVRDSVAQMQASGLALNEMRVMGGGAHSRLWNQIKANVTGLPVSVPQLVETTALGAAMLALVGAGLYPSLVEASGPIVKIAQRLEPQPAAQAIYNDCYQNYRQLYFSLVPLFDQATKHS